jgi:molybdopterin converting factor subunit 1
MTVVVRVFARARDLAGRDSISLDLPAEATVAELRRRLAAEVPALAGLLARSAFGVNSEFAEDDLPIPAGAEIALLPPVSGG